jgi:hypothetical protein
MKKYRNRFVSLMVMSVLAIQLHAQSPQLIQYSGVVVSTDSAATPVPFASIYNRSIGLGTIANYMGFFSFAARIGDTIEVSSVGYMRGLVVVPAIPENQSYTAMIFLNPEVKTLPEARVYPWFSREQFRDAFVHLNIPDDDLERARKNLNAQTMNQLSKNVRDGSLSAKQSLSNYATTYYYQGQYRPQPILSPSAWMQFFDALKNGSLKNEE